MIIKTELKNINLYEETKKHIEFCKEKFYDVAYCATGSEDLTAISYVIRKFDVKSIFEFGTWKGALTLAMWLNPSVKKMRTIDVYDELVYQIPPVSSHEFKSKDFYGKYFKECVAPNKITQILMDSRKYEVGKDETYDMVYIDANHKYDYVKNDTEKALQMKPRIIMWHDWLSEPEVTRFLNEFSLVGNNVYVFEGYSLCAVWFRNEADKKAFLEEKE